MIAVYLAEGEARFAAGRAFTQAWHVADRAIPDRKPATDGFPGNVARKMAGHLSECAVALHYCLPWKPEVERGPSDGDVGGYQVRARPFFEGRNDLFLMERDRKHADSVFIQALIHPTLVTWDKERCLRVDLAGWIYGRDAMQPRFAQHVGAGMSGYVVPVGSLNHMDDLPGLPAQAKESVA